MAASTDDVDRRWSQLMRDTQAGDRDAYDQLLREILPFLRSVVVRRCGMNRDIDEILQESLLTLHRVRHTYDPGRAFKPWVAAIAERRALDTLRRQFRIASHETQDDSYETFPDAGANKELDGIGAESELGQLLDKLPPRQREAIETTKLAELSLAEASAMSGQSVGALKVNTHRALRTLRRILGSRDRN